MVGKQYGVWREKREVFMMGKAYFDCIYHLGLFDIYYTALDDARNSESEIYYSTDGARRTMSLSKLVM